MYPSYEQVRATHAELAESDPEGAAHKAACLQNAAVTASVARCLFPLALACYRLGKLIFMLLF